MKLHATELDQLRYWRETELPLEEIIARLRRELGPTLSMQAGTAWHSVLENPPADTLEYIERGGFEFQIDAEAEILLPQITELRAERTYLVDGCEVTMSGRVDGLSGNVVYDHKLTENADAEYRFVALQWRAYLSLFSADAFEYVLYQANFDKLPIRIFDVSKLRLYRYPEMEADLLDALREFVEFARVHLPERFEPQEQLDAQAVGADSA